MSATELISEARSWMLPKFGAYDDYSCHEVSAVLGKLADTLEALLNRVDDREELSDAIDSVGEYIPGSHAADYINPDKAADAVIAYLLPETEGARK